MTQKYYTLACNPVGTDSVNVVVTSVNDYKGSVSLIYSVSNSGDSTDPTSGQLAPPPNGQVSQMVDIKSESGGGVFTANGNDGTTPEACSSSYS